MMKFSKHNRSRLWLLTALLVLALSVTLFAACDRTPDEPDTSDPAVSVDSSTETNENGAPATREPSEDTTAPAEPEDTTAPEATTKPGSGDNSQTGDPFHMAWFVVLAVSAMATAALIASRKKLL
jgi:cytoskeletal protein RodZ